MTTTKEAFSLPILGGLWHSEGTKKILAPYVAERKQSAYVRQAIVSYASNKGFQYNDIKNLRKPTYLSIKVWTKIKTLQRKSYNVNYVFLVAFYWLQQLPEFDGYNKSKLIREIIETNGHL